MKRTVALAVFALFLGSGPAAAQVIFGWSISNSTTNALSNTGPIAPGPNMFAGNLYLWLYCTDSAEGLAAMEADVAEFQGGGAPTGFTPQPGWLNAGGPTTLLIAAAGCPVGSELVGVFTVGPDAFLPDIELCLVPSAANGFNLSVECNTGMGRANLQRGFRKAALPSCLEFTECVGLAVRESTWGSIKGLYR